MPQTARLRSAARLVARLVTEVCSSAVVIMLLPFAVAWVATGHRVWLTVGWGLLIAVFSSVLPMAFIVRGARRGRWDGCGAAQAVAGAPRVRRSRSCRLPATGT